MSVINQMLKELEQRDNSSLNNKASAAIQQREKNTSKYNVFFIIFMIVLLNIMGLYGWSLYAENKALKSADYAKDKIAKSLNVNEAVNQMSPEKTRSSTQLIIDKQAHLSNSQIDKPYTEEKSKEIIAAPTTQLKEPISHHQNNLAKNVKINNTQSREVQQSRLSNKEENIIITPIVKQIPSETIGENSQALVQQKNTSSLSISRSQLPPERVVQNKYQKAERAIIDNNVPKAEKLFEDILLIQPEHKGARKQLSALWFGRKLFRPSLNLLSQGIDIYPNDEEFRLMKARVLLSQNNNTEALHVLNGFSQANNTEYQVLIANTAQALGDINNVILAYQQLVKLEAHKGTWWMGLAVAFDRTSQFKKAQTAYKMALTKKSLSSSSAQFIRQRMAELGEY